MKYLHSPQAQAIEAKESAPSSPMELLRTPSYIALSITFLSFCSMLWMLYAWLPSYIYDTFHLSLADSGITATLFLQSGSALGAMLGGYVGDTYGASRRFGRFHVLIFGLVLCPPFALGTFAAPSLLLLKISALCFGLFAGIFVSNIFASA